MRLLPFDTETAGLDGGVCEIAVVQIDETGNILGKMEGLIDPERPISPSAGGIHGIRDEDVADKPTLKQWVEVNGNPFGGADLVLIGHNVDFDIRMCAEILPETYRKIDTLKVAKQLWPESDNFKLPTLAYQYRLKTGTAHRALGDVITLVELLKLQMSVCGKGVEGLIELSKAPLSLDSYIGFGKHGPMGSDKIDGPKGTRLRNLPKSYIRWYLGTGDVDPALQEVLTPLYATLSR